jgi:predicted ATPase
MEIRIENLGAIKQATFTLGDLTIICGHNNTGKTYATYALFGFLYSWRELFTIKIDNDKIDKLLLDGVIHIDIQEYVNQVEKIVAKGCKLYTQQLSKIFASQADRFKQTDFSITFNIQDISLDSQFDRKISSGEVALFSTTKNTHSTDLIVTLLVEKEKAKIPIEILKHIISNHLKDIIFGKIFPRPFIASAERTGAAIFRKELNFARNRLLEEMGQADKTVDPMALLLKEYEDYALPIKTNVDFTRNLEAIAKKTSFIAENYPDILVDFADIIGGEYKVNRNDELYYTPKGKRIRLSMDESSSGVRSLLDIGFYLRHEAKQGDLLMVDEPELNLHPENQRRVARLLARLVNLGIKVFITTHSDYLIKEFNTLIMLNQNKPYIKQIAKAEGYRQVELILWEKVKVYIAEETTAVLPGKIKKTKFNTLTLANIDPELGIQAPSFDKTIETMNRIQEAIVWGED